MLTLFLGDTHTPPPTEILEKTCKLVRWGKNQIITFNQNLSKKMFF